MSSKYVEVPDTDFSLNTTSIKYFLETSGKFQFNEDDPNHHDHHQEPHEDGGYPPSMGRFLTPIFHLTPQLLHIF